MNDLIKCIIKNTIMLTRETENVKPLQEFLKTETIDSKEQKELIKSILKHEIVMLKDSLIVNKGDGQNKARREEIKALKIFLDTINILC